MASQEMKIFCTWTWVTPFYYLFREDSCVIRSWLSNSNFIIAPFKFRKFKDLFILYIPKSLLYCFAIAYISKCVLCAVEYSAGGNLLLLVCFFRDETLTDPSTF